MGNVRINGHEYDIEMFVFDKDGLMFESRQFWIELAQARVRAAEKKHPELSKEFLNSWMNFCGVTCDMSGEKLIVEDVSPLGILAVAPVPEEIISSAAFFAEHLSLGWPVARDLARDIFATGDELFDLAASLKPRPGFPEIFHRLRAAGIPYGVATSDTRERVILSLDMFDRFEYAKITVTVDDVERGKPNPDMLIMISEKMGIPLEKIAMLGDSYVDVAMAKAAGSIGIGIPEQEDMIPKMTGIATEIVSSLNDIQFI